LLLVTHARVDHAGATAHFKKLSGAKVAGMDRDFERLFDLRLNWDA
jgi:glyoxylase-like metal-dependent hydrolase (beta-lactamase superfamily II)